MAAYYIGTAGWSYEDWEGIVYPLRKPRGFHALAYLASYINIVEVNSTFYRPASPEMARSWLRRVADRPDFLFALKLHQVFTHKRKEFGPKDVDDVKRAADVIRLGGRLAALLVQFPWSFANTPENEAYLRQVLEMFNGYPVAVEVRNASWDTPDFYGLLRESGAGFCNIDQPLFRGSIKPSAMSTSSEFAYVRLHGRNAKNWFREEAGRDDRYDYLYSTDELNDWIRRIKELGRASGKVYVITNNHYRGQAMANALQIKNMITGGKVDIPALLLERYPVLREIVRRIEAGQGDLFPEGDAGSSGKSDGEKT